MKIIIDSYSWVEYFNGGEFGQRIYEILKSEEIYTIGLIISEIISKFKREGLDFNDAYNIILSNSRLIEIDSETAKEAGLIHAEMKKKFSNFGIVDAIILASARKIGAKIVTGDEHFKGFKEVVFLK